MKKQQKEQLKEDLSIQVIERMFVQNERMRIVIAPHPVHGKESSCVPYLDLSEALTCPSQTIYTIISRSERIKKYCGIFIMKTPGGVQPTLRVFEEGILHIIMKLQPSRCSSFEIGERLQDRYIQIKMMVRY